MRRLSTLTFAAALAATSIGCSTASNTTVSNAVKNANSNGNVAVVVNSSNANVATNRVLTREQYDKDKDRYTKEAKDAGSSIGQGLNDGYMWTKTKAELALVDSLRDSTINVDVDNDIITLKGTVATAEQKELAEKAAKGVEGQKGVKNELKVQANDSMTNQMVNGNTAKTSNSNANMKK